MGHPSQGRSPVVYPLLLSQSYLCLGRLENQYGVITGLDLYSNPSLEPSPPIEPLSLPHLLGSPGDHLGPAAEQVSELGGLPTP